MKIIADLHVHGKYARATSKQLDPANLEKWAMVKGVNLLGTGDFTHPKWVDEIKNSLKDNGTGIHYSSSGFPFVLQSEISLAYTQGGKGRRVHHVVLAPSMEVVEQITAFLLSKGRVDYDGRPIFGMSSIEFAEKLHSISPETEVIPAHAWTPWFGVFGSESGFDSLKECFEEKAKLVHSIETGMSSDPAMNWRISKLDGITLTSNSDLHSFWPWRMGREANVFEMKELTYKNVLDAIRERKGFAETIEVDPGYGKYHYDGHRNCNVSMSAAEATQHNNICPACRRQLTIGVEHRVEELADRPAGYRPEGAVPFRTLLPLSELLVAVNGGMLAGKKTWQEYNRLVNAFGNEFAVLLDAEEKKISEIAGEKVAAVVMKNRSGALRVKPGYDGVYGELTLDGSTDAAAPQKPTQRGLNDFLGQ